ncbi:unnamed protein product [Ceratitis capitata]|uniref:(Mediterranean fruit fly) hypothetical protein n=1 Tax=Ceratitis capitata TaxID=7213 RepID=A0A811V0S6_CERCA|nr:unnamed protein product [Ceratitis capitata]
MKLKIIEKYKKGLGVSGLGQLDAVSSDPVTNEIIFFTEQMGLEVDSNDIAEVVTEHDEDLTIEDLVKLQCASEQEVQQSNLSDEEITEEPQSSKAIREILNSWEYVASPQSDSGYTCNRIIYNNAVSHFE